MLKKNLDSFKNLFGTILMILTFYSSPEKYSYEM